MKNPNPQPQNRNRANVFICYSPTDLSFVRELDEALKRSRRRSAINWNEDLSGDDFSIQSTLIEAADTFVFVVSPASVKSEACLRQLTQALKKAKLIVPVIHGGVESEDMPLQLRELNAVSFEATNDFHESFQTLIKQIPTDLKVDVFICYSRADKTFVDSLYSQLETQDRSAWVDLKSIPFAERWEQEIYLGIEAADNFLFVISPSSVSSEYCAKELAYALEQRKRIIPLLLHAVDMTAAPASLTSLQWIDFNTVAPETSIATLVKTIETDQDYTRMHTRLLARALEWIRNNNDFSFLLRGSDLKKAEKWLVQAGADIEPKPTQLQTQYVIRSRQGESSRQRKMTVGVTAGLIIAIALAALAAVQSVRAESRRKEAEEQRSIAEKQTVIAEKRQREAEEQKAIAEEQTREAQRQKEEAVRQTGIAEHKTEEARQERELKEEQRLIAEAKRREADEQRRVAIEQRDLARSRELATSARSQLDADPEISALMAIEALKSSPSAEAEAILRESLDEARTRAVLPLAADGLLSYAARAVYHPQGKLILTTRHDEAVVWDGATGKSLAILPGDNLDYDESSVQYAIFSPNGKFIATAGKDDTAEVWETSSGRKLADLKGLKGSWAANSIAFSPDSSIVVTAGGTEVCVWKAATGERLATLEIKNEGRIGSTLNSIAYSPNGKWVVATSAPKKAYIWETATWKLQAELSGHQDTVVSAAFSHDSTRVVTASLDKTARIWDVSSGRSLFELRGHTNKLFEAIFSPDDKWVATASADHTGRLWDAATGEGWAGLSGHTHFVWGITFSHDGKFVLTSSFDATARVWELQTEEWKWERKAARLVGVLRGHSGGVTSAAFSPDGRAILTASNDMTARVWESPTGSSLIDLVSDRTVNSAVFSPDGRFILTASGSNDDEPDWNTTRLWDSATGKLLLDLRGQKSRVTGAEFSPDGRHLMSVTNQDGARVWEAATGKLVAHISFEGMTIRTAMFSPDGKRVATINDFNKAARVCELPTCKQIIELPGDKWGIVGLAFSPNGRYIAGGGKFGDLWVWDAATGNVIASAGRVGVGEVRSVAFSPDNKFIVIAGPGAFSSWVVEATSGKKIAELKGHQRGVYNASFSPDGRFIVTASEDKTSRVWETNTWTSVVELRGHTDQVFQAKFSPNSLFVVTASRDGTARVWETATGRSISELRGAGDFVRSAEFGPDGRSIVTASQGSKIARVYKCETCVPSEVLVGLVPSRIMRPPLTKDERLKYLHEPPAK